MFHRKCSSFTAVVAIAACVTIVDPSAIAINPAVAQEASDYMLMIEGEELQNCIITVRYFRNRKLTKTVVNRSTLSGGRAEEPLESQHEGLEVIVQSASVPMAVQIVRRGKIQAEEKIDASGLAKLALGKIGRAPFQPIAIQLTKRESSLIESLAIAMNNGTSTSNLVSESSSATVDGPCLDVFLRELKRIIGQPQDIEATSDGWIGYGKNEDSRTLVGVIKGSNGVCGLKTLLEKGKIVDVVPNCPNLPDNFFREPVGLKEYTRQAKLLTQSLFAGNAAKAHALYSPKFQSQVTVDQLSELCDLVKQRYGKSIESIEFKRSELLDYNFEQQSNLLNVDLLVLTDTGARCISRTAFSIQSGRNQIGRAHLGAINVFQVFQSSHPENAQAAENLLTGLSQKMQVDDLLSQYPEELRTLANSEEIQGTLSRIGDFLNGAAPEIDFDLWNVAGTDELVVASGPVKFASNDCFAELQFNGKNQILGFSFYGPALSESTLGSFDFDVKVKQAAELYWSKLLQEEADTAYAMLHPDFQKQFSLDDLKAQLESPQNENSPLKGVVTDHLRLSSSPYRATPFLVSVLLTASFEQGMPLSLTCELPMSMPDDSTQGFIYDFSNDFEMDFPVSAIPTETNEKEGMQAIVGAFMNYSIPDLMALIAPASQSAIDQEALEAYMEKLTAIGGRLTTPKTVSRTVEYMSGLKRFRGNATLETENGEPLPIECWFLNGFLERFSITDSRLIDFVALLEETAEVERRVERFTTSWMNEKEDVNEYILPSVRSDAMTQTLTALRQNFVAEHGELVSVKVLEKQPYQGGGTLQFAVALTGVTGTKSVTISVEVGAFGGFISGVTF